jgi:hypothetical protein
MPIVTASPHAMLIVSVEPLSPRLRIFWATTPAPNAYMTNVPRNSANTSRRIVDEFIPSQPGLSSEKIEF